MRGLTVTKYPDAKITPVGKSGFQVGFGATKLERVIDQIVVDNDDTENEASDDNDDTDDESSDFSDSENWCCVVNVILIPTYTVLQYTHSLSIHLDLVCVQSQICIKSCT